MNARILAKSWSLVLVAVALLSAGCGTIRGTAPNFSESPGRIEMVTAPQAPAALETDHLIREVEFPPRPDNLQALDAKPSKPNNIFYPRLRLKTEEEIVNSPPNGSGQVTVEPSIIRMDPESFIAVLDLKDESAREAASGRLAADFIYRAIDRESQTKQSRIRIADRERIWSLIEDERKRSAGSGSAAASGDATDVYNAAQIFDFSTYWISGAVTTFSLENKELPFDYALDTNDYVRFSKQIKDWQRDYDVYVARYNESYMTSYNNYVEDFNRRAAQLESNYKDYIRRYDEYSEHYDRIYTPAYRNYQSNLRTKATLSNLVFLPLHLVAEIVTLGNADTWTKASPYPMLQMERQLQQPTLGKPSYPYPKLDLITARDGKSSIPARYDKDDIMAVFEAQKYIPPPVRKMATVCNIGVTLRLVERKTSQIMWIGNCTARNIDLQYGMKMVCDHLVQDLLDSFQIVNED